MSDTELGYDFEVRKSGDVVIARHNRVVATLRGDAAERFLKKIEAGDSQQVMARATGNYKRGNERA